MPAAVDRNVTQQLRDVDIFREVSPRHLDRIASQGTVQHHDPGREFMTEGAEGLGFHLILDGDVEIWSGEEMLRVLGPGDYVGEIAVIDGKPRTASVRARTLVRTWAISGPKFRTLLEKEPGLAFAVLTGLCARVRERAVVPPQRDESD